MHTPTVYITVLSRIQLSHQTIQKFSATHLKMFFAIQKFIFAHFFHFYEIAIHKSLLFMNFLMVFIFVLQIDRYINLRSSKFIHYHHQIIIKLIRLVLSKFIQPEVWLRPGDEPHYRYGAAAKFGPGKNINTAAIAFVPCSACQVIIQQGTHKHTHQPTPFILYR